MKFTGALIKEQGVTFAVAMVKPNSLTSSNRESFRNELSLSFGNVPVVFAEESSGGKIKYNGRPDLVKFLAHLHPSQIPWREYKID